MSEVWGLNIEQWILVLSGGQILLIILALLLLRQVKNRADLLPEILESVEDD